MTLEKTLVRRVVLLGVFAMIANLAAAQTRSLELLVVNRGENSLSIIDPVSGKTISRVPLGEQPHQMAVSTDGKLAFVTNTITTRSGGKLIGPSISVIDVPSRRELRRVNIGPFSRPHGIVFAAGKVYFTAQGYRAVGCYDPATNQIDWLLGNGQDSTTMIYVNQAADKIFAENTGSDTVTLMERRSDPSKWTNRVDYAMTHIPVGDGPHGIDMTPDGRHVWTSNDFDSTVSIIDVAAKKVTETFKVPSKNPARLKFTPDGRRVLITDPDGLLVLDVATRKEIKRVALGKSDHEEILFSPDGARVYIPNDNDMANVAIIDMKTLEITGYLSTGKHPESMAWVERSPNGSKLRGSVAFARLAVDSPWLRA